jgi:hypothetical protein
MRTLVRILGLIGLLAGLTFLGQGAGLIPGSIMSGRVEWAVIGSALAAVSAVVLWSTSRPR